MTKLSKHMKSAYQKVDRNKLYGVAEGVDLVKEFASRKFDETVEIAINLGVDTRHADQQVRGVVNLPHGTGKEVRVIVFARGEKAEEALAAGADAAGAEELMERVQSGWMDFDRVIASPDMMAIVGRLGKVLGPRGLMPNPKLGTVTPNIGEAVKSSKGGAVQFRAEKTGIVHARIGRASFTKDQLQENLLAFFKVIQASRPSGAKGTFIKKMAISSTMGPGVRLDVSSIQA